MGNASRVSNKIWRTVVVAGAMLGTPLAVAGCGKKKPPEMKPQDPPKTDGSGSDAAGSSAERPRTPEDERPIGRGFVLA